MRILFFLLFPIFLSAQINRAYGVIEIGATFPTSSATGPKFAYRTVDSSFYRWVSGSTWIKIIPDEIMPFDSIYFTPSSVDPDTAELKYSQDLETFVFGADGTIVEIGQKEAWYVKNQSGSTIPKGTVVRAAGTLGSSGRILIEPMEIDGTVNSKYLLGVTASNISNGSNGYVIHFGKLRKLNTSAWTDGAVLYADAAGGLTATEPNPPNLRLPIAFVVHSHATNGVLAIRVQTGNMLHELHDVDTTGIANDGTLVWDGSKWKASDGPVITTADTASMLSNYPTKAEVAANPTTIANTRIAVSNGNNLIGYPDFTRTSTGNLLLGTTTDVPTSILTARSTTKSSSPFPFHTTAESNAITGVAGNFEWLTDGLGPGYSWHNGTRKAYGLESTANTFIQNRVLHIDANGQATTNSAFNFNGTQLLLTPSTAVGKKLFINSTATPIATGIDIDLGGKYSGTATSVPKLAIYNDGTFQFGFGMWNNGLSYIVDHNTLGHYFYAGADSTLKLSITRSLVNFPQLVTVGSAATTGTLLSVGASASIPSSRLYVQSPDQGIGSGIVVKSTNTSTLGYASVYLESANSEYSQFFSTNSTYTPYRTISASTFGHYSTAANGMAIQLDGASAVLKVGIGANEITRTTATGFGILNNSPARPLHVTGAARITGSAGTPTGILGRDGNGDISNLTLGTGLSISSGTLSATGTDTHFANTNLTATGNRTHDWANYNFTWTNMKKFMWGADSLFKITKEFSGYTYAVMRNPSGQTLLDLQGDDDAVSNSAEIRLTDTETGNIVFIAHDDRGFGSDGFRMEHYNGANYHNMLYVNKTSRLFHINQGGYSAGVYAEADASVLSGLGRNIIRGGVGTFNTDTIAATYYIRTKNNLTKNRDMFGVYTQNGSIDTMYFRLDKVGRMFQYKDAFLTQNVSFTAYGAGAKEASDLYLSTPRYLAAFTPSGTGQGTVVDLGISPSLKLSGGVLDLKRKSLIDSLPVASVTLDAAAHNLAINNLTDLDFDTDSGNASIHLDDDNFNIQSNTEITLNTNQDAGLTLNSTANIYGANTEGTIGFKAGGEQWLWHYVNDDADPDTAMTLNTVGNLAYLKLQDYGNGNINSALFSEYPGKYIPSFSTTGKVLEYRLARDTFIEDVTLFSVGTMMYNCQELTIVSSMTSLAPSNMEIRFPDAGEEYRGKKIIVYSKKKDAGSFIPEIRMVGGVSRLFFTTNPGIGGTDPSNQSVLQIDDTTWSDHGTSFEFTCLKIDNTPNYRWVLKQR